MPKELGGKVDKNVTWIKNRLKFEYHIWIKYLKNNYKLGKITFYRSHSIYQYYIDSLPTLLSVIQARLFLQIDNWVLLCTPPAHLLGSYTLIFSTNYSSPCTLIRVLHVYFFVDIFPPCMLIRAYTLIFFWYFCLPAWLFGTALLLGTLK